MKILVKVKAYQFFFYTLKDYKLINSFSIENLALQKQY